MYDALFVPGTDMSVLGEHLMRLWSDETLKPRFKSLPETGILTIQSEWIQRLISEEHLLLTPEFVLSLIGKMLSDKYVMLGGYPRFMGVAKDKRINGFYLVPRLVADHVDIVKEFFNLRDQVYEENLDRRSFNLLDYVMMQPYATHDEEKDGLLASVLKTLMKGELSVLDEGPHAVILPKRKDRPLPERLYHIFQSKPCQPISLDELMEKVNADGGRKYVRTSVSLLLHKDHRFINNGRKGFFALREWRLPFFGLNADIVNEVLSGSDRPMATDEILSILTQYSYNANLTKTDLSTVVSLAKDRFVKLATGVYGLVDRSYNQTQIDAALAAKRSLAAK